MLVNDRTTWRRFELTHEEGQWVILRPLTANEYQTCLDVRSGAVLKKFQDMPSEMLKGLRDTAPTRNEADAEREIDSITAIKFAVTEWSYDAECNDINKEALDMHTAEVIKDFILEMNAPRPLSSGNGLNSASSGVHLLPN